MLMPDVNVLVAAYRTDSTQHDVAKSWLERAVSGHEAVGLSDAVATGFVRVVTHQKVFIHPTPLNDALTQLDSLYDASGVFRVTPGRTHWSIFSSLCRNADARGNLVSDASHAATAIEAGATWVSFDRDFARFANLTWRVPETAAP
jgi:toxin-antitoxin system PIN domain toxin